MILAQYEDDPEAVDELVTAAAEGRFDHKAAELEETAPARAAIRAARDELTAKGFTVTTDRVSITDGYHNLARLVDADGAKGTVADADPEHLLAQVSARWHTAYVTADGVQVEDPRSIGNSTATTMPPSAPRRDSTTRAPSPRPRPAWPGWSGFTAATKKSGSCGTGNGISTIDRPRRARRRIGR